MTLYGIKNYFLRQLMVFFLLFSVPINLSSNVMLRIRFFVVRCRLTKALELRADY